ncbi:MAG: hypothetical protein JSS27_18955 [Planctomycetes bacterium]|nr:hypothetical protein [Planctomycetota bacterium]
MKYSWALILIAAAITGCRTPLHGSLPPATMLEHPGPGVGGPGPGVMTIGPTPPVAVGVTSQVAFVSPEGAMISWDAAGTGGFDSEPLILPARYNFPQGALYRLKLTNIPGRAGVELYPTIEVGPVVARTEAYLAHNAIPFQLTEEDFDQVMSGNFVTKVIYLPDPEFQELAIAGVETLVSTRLDPGVDPIVEADRRGAIMAVIRIGNKDLEVPGSDQFVGDAAYGAPMAMLPPGVAGATAPQYGMPITGTPIGLPGPPHIPLGGPAGLQKHVIKNHTKVHMPAPTTKQKIHVKGPALSYPAPANHAYISEMARPAHAGRPLPAGMQGEYCP